MNRRAAGRHRAPSRLAVLRLLRVFVRPYAWRVCVIVGLLAVQAAGSLYLPALTADIVNDGVERGDIAYIWRAGGVMIAIAFLVAAVNFAAVYWTSRVSMGVGADMRAALYHRVQSFSAREVSRFGIPSLITRNINDVQQVQLFLQTGLAVASTAAFMTLGGVVMAVREGAALSLLLIIAVPVMAVAVGVEMFAVVPLFRSVQAKIDRLNRVLREQITGVRVIRAMGRTGSEQARFESANSDLTGTILRANRLFVVVTPFLILVLSLSNVSVIWFGSHLVSEGTIPVGNLLAFLSYVLQILVNVLATVIVIAQAPRAMASAERIDQVIGTSPADADPPRPRVPAVENGGVEFRGVTFRYPGSERSVLRDLSFVLEPGCHSAIIGGTGSGKTTLLHLILRFLVAPSGAVLVNGADVREQAAERMRMTIGLVPQEAFLFRGTVASNLRFGAPGASDTQLWRALDVAQAADFVASMPGQLDAVIDQGGTNVSGGQRQRLSIARALARRPRLYLFDDCFSALDAATDARLRAALRAETREQRAAVVTVAQRVATIMDADQIIVLDGGRVAGIGTHHGLLASCGVYQQVVASQLDQEAAA